MALSAIVDKLKRQSKNDFKGRQFEVWLILQANANTGTKLCALETSSIMLILTSSMRSAQNWAAPFFLFNTQDTQLAVKSCTKGV